MNLADLLEETSKLTGLIEADSASEMVEGEKWESAYHRHLREKAGEGENAMQILNATEAVFISLLNWYRDLQALHLGAHSLLQPTLKEELQYRVDRGAFPCLSSVQYAIKTAQESLSRSLPLKHVLETLFLSLRAF